MRQTLAIIISLVLVLLLGMWGQYDLDPARFQSDFLTALYEVLMLFALGGDWTTGVHLTWQLELARLLAPALSVAGVLIVLTRGAWVSLSNFFIRFWQGHVVVVGLGEKGWQFAQHSVANSRTVIVESDPENPLITRAREAGVSVIVGDILDEAVMRQIALAGARHLVTFCGNDGTTVEIALRSREFLAREKGQRERLRVHLHVNSTHVASRLENYAKFYGAERVAEIEFFSVYDLSARILLNKYPPDVAASSLGQQQVHIALYGFGLLAEQILTEAVRVCHFLNGSQIRFTLVDDRAREKLASVTRLHPGIETLCSIDYITDFDIHAPSHDVLPEDFLQSVTQHVLCLHDDENNLELALALRSTLLEHVASNAPIMVRMQHASGLARLLESRPGEPEIPDGLYPFGMLDEALDDDNILSDRLDALARAIHDDYLMRRGDLDTDQRLHTSLATWSELSEPDRKSNRLQADHLAAKLRAIRCRYDAGPANGFTFTDAECEALAGMEHNRWRANKIYAGWRQGNKRIEGARINPFNVPWQSLDPAEREANIEAIRRVPEILEKHLGWRIRREHYIGVTGHRPHRLDIKDSTLIAAVEARLDEIVQRNPGKVFILVSPLAEGADRLVARIAMERYHMALHVPLPLPFDLYQTDFESRESLREFTELIGRAENYAELSMRFGSLETLARVADDADNEARNRQYALVGAYLAQRCDDVIAIYDGAGGQGTGGTAQIVEWCRQGQVPADFINSATFQLNPVETGLTVVDVAPVQN